MIHTIQNMDFFQSKCTALICFLGLFLAKLKLFIITDADIKKAQFKTYIVLPPSVYMQKPHPSSKS